MDTINVSVNFKLTSKELPEGGSLVGVCNYPCYITTERFKGLINELVDGLNHYLNSHDVEFTKTISLKEEPHVLIVIPVELDYTDLPAFTEPLGAVPKNMNRTINTCMKCVHVLLEKLLEDPTTVITQTEQETNVYKDIGTNLTMQLG